MSTYNTDLDNINNICSLVKEIVELANDLRYDYPEADLKEYQKAAFKHLELIVSKALTVRDKAQSMENRLKQYKTTIESLGFKRERRKR
jgi:hypothetical protein